MAGDVDERELISVIMSTYNETENELKQSIESILNQTWENIEFIIVNDNPDNEVLKKVLYEYKKKEKKIKLLQNKKNIGLARSLNYAWKQAKGKYVARMDADDISMPERLEKEMNYLNEHSLDMVASNRINISEDGKKKEGCREIPCGRDVERLLPYSNPIIHSSVLIKREVLVRLQGYRELVPAEDYDLWLRMLTFGYKVGILDEPLIFYRVRKSGISQTNYYKQYLLKKYVKELFRKRMKYGGEDGFSKEDMENYIAARYTEKKRGKYHTAKERFNDGVRRWKNGRKFAGIMIMKGALFIDCNFASDIFQLILYERKRAQLLKKR